MDTTPNSQIDLYLLCGGAGHGKDTFHKQTNGLVDWNLTFLSKNKTTIPVFTGNRKRIAFADKVKEIAIQQLIANKDNPEYTHLYELYSQCSDIDILKQNITFRLYLIKVATQAKETNPTVWAELATDDLPDGKYNITDFRFPEEYPYCCKIASSITTFRLYCPDVPLIDNPTEHMLDDFEVDYVGVWTKTSTLEEAIFKLKNTYPVLADYAIIS